MALEHALSDCRGDMNVSPDPDWSSKISMLNHEQVDKYIASFARCGPLSPDQVCALIQHLPPPAPGWSGYPCVLEDYLGAVKRWLSDVERGAVPAYPTPNELAAWCDNVGVGLPRSFVDAVIADPPRIKAAPQAAEPVNYAPWITLGAPTLSPVPRNRGRGRPKSPFDRDAQLRAIAIELQKAAAREGNKLTISQIAAQLAKTSEFGSLAPSTISRKLNGKTATETAKELIGLKRAKHKWKG